MNLRLSLLGLFFAVVVATAFAHGSKVHVKGTVEKISADSVVVKTADGKSVEVKFAASTVSTYDPGGISRRTYLPSWSVLPV